MKPATRLDRVRHTTGYRLADAVLGALSQAVPQAIPAAGAGQVAIVLFFTMPVALGPTQLPIGIQLMAGHGRDDRLLAAAVALERVLGNGPDRLGVPPLLAALSG